MNNKAFEELAFGSGQICTNNNGDLVMFNLEEAKKNRKRYKIREFNVSLERLKALLVFTEDLSYRNNTETWD